MTDSRPSEAPLRVRLDVGDLVPGDGLNLLETTLERFSTNTGTPFRCLELHGNAPAWGEYAGSPEGGLQRWGKRLSREASRSGSLRVGWADGVLRGPALELMLACDLLMLGHGASVRVFPPGEGYVPVAGSWTRAIRRAGPTPLLAASLEPSGLPATRAVELGLASAVLQPEGWEALLLDLAGKDSRGLGAVADLARRVNGLSGRPAEALERAVFSWCFAGGQPARAIREFRGPDTSIRKSGAMPPDGEIRP